MVRGSVIINAVSLFLFGHILTQAAMFGAVVLTLEIIDSYMGIFMNKHLRIYGKERGGYGHYAGSRMG